MVKKNASRRGRKESAETAEGFYPSARHPRERGDPESDSYFSHDVCGFAATIHWIPRTRFVLLSQNLHLAEDDDEKMKQLCVLCDDFSTPTRLKDLTQLFVLPVVFATNSSVVAMPDFGRLSGYPERFWPRFVAA